MAKYAKEVGRLPIEMKNKIKEHETKWKKELGATGAFVFMKPDGDDYTINVAPRLKKQKMSDAERKARDDAKAKEKAEKRIIRDAERKARDDAKAKEKEKKAKIRTENKAKCDAEKEKTKTERIKRLKDKLAKLES